jgi:hypothetical protein
MTPRNLVAVKLSGGLGNQMFAYAAGLALATRLGGELRFDLRSYALPGSRPLQLGAFGIALPTYTPTWWKLQRLARELSGGRWRPGPERLAEANDFEPGYFSLTIPCYIRGFFQSWRYFEGFEDVVRTAFDTSRLASPRTAELEAAIRSADCPVMVHVRRGDYRESPNIATLLGRDHYDAARSQLEARGMKPTYFLFSDDLADAAALLNDWPGVAPVDRLDNLETLRVMSLCRHHIIANSSFSWWAAWLGTAPDKLVVAPRTWFGPDYERELDMDARLPPEWIRV